VGIALKYTLFAVVATVVNILGQETFLNLYHAAYSIPLSVLAGTFVGLFTKYVLDKKYIFRFRASSAKHDTATFMLYTVMGLATTAIFWSFEFAFDYLFATKQMRYLGGVLGLAIGYYVKYQLDKRFVFVVREQP
jgi:putative flippase GtrA